MRRMLTLWRREAGSYFVSPVAYILATMFLALMGVGLWFIAGVRLTTGGTSMYDLLRALFGAVAWIALLMVVPVLTMRSFAEEKRSGTLETLLTAPVRDGEVVIAKYLGALTVFVVMWLPTLLYFPMLSRLSDVGLPLDRGALAGAYLGIFLIGGFFLSVGVLCSALTNNLIVASVSTFTVLFLLFLAGFLPEVSPVPALREISRPFSPVLHMLEFSRGVVDSRAVVLYLSGTALMLMATVRVLESRRWRA